MFWTCYLVWLKSCVITNRLGDQEPYYPADLEYFCHEDGDRLYIGLKVDAATQRVLDCKWNASEGDFERVSRDVIGLPLGAALNNLLVAGAGLEPATFGL